MRFGSFRIPTAAATVGAGVAPTAYTPPAASPPNAAPAAPAGRPIAPPPVADDALPVSAGVAMMAIALLALVSSVTSLRNGFAYDDLAVVAQNARVHTLHGWWHFFGQAYWPPPIVGGLYRPIVILMYAVLWKIGGGSAFPFHAASVTLYVASAMAVYRLTRLLLPSRGAWVAAALFAVHPVHVESVGNVVGVSEVIAGLGMVLAVGNYIIARRRDVTALSPRTIAGICALYVVATLSKEHAFFLPALLAVAELCAVDDTRPWRARIRTLLPAGVTIGVIGAIYLVVRGSIDAVVVGQRFTATLGYYPWTVRLYTFLQVVPEWVRLLFWPARLSMDYSPQQTMIPLMWTWTQLPGVVIVLLIVPVTAIAWWRNRAAAFGLAWLFVTLAIPSGLLVATGYLLAERTFFTPSVGAVVLVGVLVEWALGQARLYPEDGRVIRGVTAAAVMALVVAGAGWSAARQPIWKNNDTLFRQGVIDAPLSYRTHYALGGLLVKEGKFGAAERELRAAIRLFPVDPEPMEFLASQYAANKFWQPAIPLLQVASAIREKSKYDTPAMRRYSRTLLANGYIETAQYDSAASLMRRAVASDPTDSTAMRLLKVAEERAAARSLESARR
ncbi:MAG TPA: hypothetical protein VFJ74_14235 [Gemmatimonadaceae bacterium]|nr:hypothetical protein [Gemmatimonadaceae bacterium]